MLREFKAFAFKGNVVDLAVGVIIGTAFGKIVSSLVDNVLMPLIGLMVGGVDLSERGLSLGGAEILYGSFLQSVLDFLIIAFVLFLIIRQANRMMPTPEPAPEPEPEPSEEIRLLTEIRDALTARRD